MLSLSSLDGTNGNIGGVLNDFDNSIVEVCEELLVKNDDFDKSAATSSLLDNEAFTEQERATMNVKSEDGNVAAMQRYLRIRYPKSFPDYTEDADESSNDIDKTESQFSRSHQQLSNAGNSYGQTPLKNLATSTHKKKRHFSQRCYRLNLERPFDIHNEQSPLEYGDYMKPWRVEDYPAVTGPLEYMPPRHLGGKEDVWRTIMQYSRLAEREGVGTKYFEGKVGSHDEIESLSAETCGSTDQYSSRSNWHKMSDRELSFYEQFGEVDQRTGEYTFRVYDLNHVVGKRVINNYLPVESILEESGDDAPTSQPSTLEFISILSTDTSSSSEEINLNFKTKEEMADDTARLFRRSALSLRDKAEADAELAARDQIRLKEVEMSKKAEEESNSLEAPSSIIKGDIRRSTSSRRLYRKSSSSSFSSQGGKEGVFSSKKLLRSLSSLTSKVIELNGTPSGHGSEFNGRVCQNPKLRKSSSLQAATIEKARDLVDFWRDSDEDDEDDNENKKPPTISLYVFGEYDILNDLINDGAKRLSKSQALSDMELLWQNSPCPPPNRWVKPTGWSKCNPGSCYAANPPEGYDLKDYGKNDVVLPKNDIRDTEIVDPIQKIKVNPHSKNEESSFTPKDSSATQTTAVNSSSNSEDILEVNIIARKEDPMTHMLTPAVDKVETTECSASSTVQVMSAPVDQHGKSNHSNPSECLSSTALRKKGFGRKLSKLMGLKRG